MLLATVRKLVAHKILVPSQKSRALCFKFVEFRAQMLLLCSFNNNKIKIILINFRAGRRQPDNREGNEFCVGVLNNFYGDGVRFHDISCHHRKPIICEQ